MKNITTIPLLIITLLVLISCEKKPDLLEKAFKGKFSDNVVSREEKPEEEKIEEMEEEELPPEEIVVDHKQEEIRESVFLPDKVLERQEELPFEVDPEAPQINTEEAKMYDLIHTLCQIMKVNYIIDPSVKDQTITIGMVEGEAKMKTSELFDLLLKLHDLTWVQEAGFIRIVPLDSADVIPGLNMLYGSRPNENLLQEELAMQIIPLKYVTASDMSNIIKGFLSPSARVMEEPKHNAIIIIDKNHFIRKAMDIIPLFDVSALYNKKMVLYNLSFVDATEMATQLDEIMTAYGYESESQQVSIHPIEALNAILVISTFRDVFDEISFWLEKLDQEAQFEEPTIFIYNVQNTTAATLSNTLSSLLGIQQGRAASSGSKGASNRRTTNPNQNAKANNMNRTNRMNKGGSMSPGTTPVSGQNQNGETMIVDEENNALIFHTTPNQYHKIRKTLEKIDVLPRQVFLEVTVFRVDLNDTFSLGFDWSGQSGDLALGAEESEILGEGSTEQRYRSLGLLSGSGGGNFFSYTFKGFTDILKARLDAAKTKGFANILQQPHMMAIDNKPASISIGKDVPIPNSRTTYPGQSSSTSTPFVSSSIQYRNTGVSLTVTPHINANGLIRMEIELSVSSPGEASPDIPAPPINQNDLNTEMIVRDGQTVVMGGMISDQESGGKTSVPLLGRIPLLKHLFTNRNQGSSRNELIVMITPKVIDTEEDSIRVSKEFMEKIKKEYKDYVLD
ncbi:MAG: type II secretion system protein GspD [Acidobacteria bacterium]|nr:MAG: type II secretion system protein GspD [Acidobacteriota bacterium]